MWSSKATKWLPQKSWWITCWPWDPGDVKHRIQGVETREPAFNLPALWIPESQKEEAMLAGYTVVDPATVIATHLTEVFRRNLGEFLGRQETQQLLDNLAKRAPKAVEDLVPNVLNLGTVQKVLQNLVREGVSVRDLLTIVETLSDYGNGIKDPDQLTEYVRSRMGRTIVKAFPWLGRYPALADPVAHHRTHTSGKPATVGPGGVSGP